MCKCTPNILLHITPFTFSPCRIGGSIDLATIPAGPGFEFKKIMRNCIQTSNAFKSIWSEVDVYVRQPALRGYGQVWVCVCWRGLCGYPRLYTASPSLVKRIVEKTVSSLRWICYPSIHVNFTYHCWSGSTGTVHASLSGAFEQAGVPRVRQTIFGNCGSGWSLCMLN